MTEIEQDLEEGYIVICANCPSEIRKGDEYVIRGKYMYCCEECAEEGEEGG